MGSKSRYGIPIVERPGIVPSADDLLRSAFEAHGMGRIEEAGQIARRVLQMRPRNYLARQILGVSCFGLGDVEGAICSFTEATQIEPANGDAYNNLGNVLVELGRYDEAIGCLVRATELSPQSADAHSNLGRALGELGRYDEALAAAQIACRLSPNLAEAYINLGKLLMDVGLLDQGLAVFAKALEVAPGRVDAHSNYLMSLQYSPEYSAADLRAAAEEWARRHAPLSMAPTSARTRAGGRLRLGYVSGDFKAHPVGYVMEKLLPAHDRSRFEVFAYSNCRADDAIAERLRQSVDHWRNISAMNDDEAAQLVRKDGIDILIDLAGHSALNRLGVFARKPAAMQATWLGYFATTGMPQMDFILRERAQIPESEEGGYVERCGRLSDRGFCFAAPHEDVQVSMLPAEENGFVTFGCFNNLSKMNSAVFGAWAQVLHAVPGSKMYLDRRAFGSEIARQVVVEAFASQGIDAKRVEFATSCGRRSYLEAYGRVDVVLDTFPFNGATTTYEALWMGVPVVTRTWDRMVGHFGESILLGAGCGEWIAQSDSEFVAKAVALSSDLPTLAAIRAELRDRFLASPLCGGESYARSFEDSLIELWEARS